MMLQTLQTPVILCAFLRLIEHPAQELPFSLNLTRFALTITVY